MIDPKKTYKTIKATTLLPAGTKLTPDLSASKTIQTGKTGLVFMALGMGKGALYVPESNLKSV